MQCRRVEQVWLPLRLLLGLPTALTSSGSVRGGSLASWADTDTFLAEGILLLLGIGRLGLG
ncbi:MAG: hypothetical protein ACUVRV_12600 [Cyanobacteriota bacterium]